MLLLVALLLGSVFLIPYLRTPNISLDDGNKTTKATTTETPTTSPSNTTINGIFFYSVQKKVHINKTNVKVSNL